MAVSCLPAVAFGYRLEGPARYRGDGHCFVNRNPIIFPARPLFGSFKPRQVGAKGRVSLVVDYELPSGRCHFVFGEGNDPAVARPVFDGRCVEHLLGNPLPLAPAVDPRSGRELLPLVVQDTFGFGSVHGYLVFPPGGLSNAFDTPGPPRYEIVPPPIGFSGHFAYTMTWIPVYEEIFPHSPWQPLGFTMDRCFLSGRLRLGPVPAY